VPAAMKQSHRADRLEGHDAQDMAEKVSFRQRVLDSYKPLELQSLMQYAGRNFKAARIIALFCFRRQAVDFIAAAEIYNLMRQIICLAGVLH
jgi:hypothetical protein